MSETINNSKIPYDVIIVGAGAAGLSASIYGARRELKTLVVAKNIGGQMNWASEIENYPGLEPIAGFDLAQKIKIQAEKFGATFVTDEIEKMEKRDDGVFHLIGVKEEYLARSVILAFGLTPRNLNIPGEKEFTGRGVAYCATCDGPLFKNKVVGVVGGGNSAFESAEFLAKIAKKVYVFHVLEKFQAEPFLFDGVKALENVEFIHPVKIKEIKGDKKVTGVVLAEAKDETKIQELKIDGLFVEIGYEAKTGWLKGMVDLNEKGEIKINRDGESSVPGIFASGDCADTHYKQVVISAGEGAKAALGVYKYLASFSGKVVAPDWGKK